MPYLCSTDEDRRQMLTALRRASIDELFVDLPNKGHMSPPNIPSPLGELELLTAVQEIASANRVIPASRSFLGAGAYRHFIPALVRSVAQRHEFYAPYALRYSEVHQGTLQALYEFQSILVALTGMECANSSLYDGASACAEAVLMARRLTGRKGVVSSRALHPELRQVIETYCLGLDAPIVAADFSHVSGLTPSDACAQLLDESSAALVVQYPNFFGGLEVLQELADAAHHVGALLIVYADPLALTLLRAPGDEGADIVVGECQPLGLPLSFGGPSLGFLATRLAYLDQIPGAIVEVGSDQDGRRGFTFIDYGERDRSLLREAAHTNIGTTSTLPAVLMAAYVAALGKRGLQEVAELGYHRAHYLASQLSSLAGCEIRFRADFFNEFAIQVPADAQLLVKRLHDRGFLPGLSLGQHYPQLENCLLLTASELTPRCAIDEFVESFAEELHGMQSAVRHPEYA